MRCGTLTDASTPYDLGFVPGEHVHVREGAGRAIVHNATQIRWVTPYQVSAYIVPADECDAPDITRQYLALRAALLASPAGRLLPLIEVQPIPSPARIPPRYRDCPIIVADACPVTDTPGWMGEHLVDEDGDCTIYIEREYAEAALAHHRYDILWATLRHEHFESGCELALARAEFPTAAARQLGGLAVAMNGLAHKMTVRMLGEAAGEREYNDMLDRQRTEIGLPYA